MWTWSELDERQMQLIEDVEADLPGDYVIAYRQGRPSEDVPAHLALRPAALDAAQVARLQEVEREIGCVAVAYERG